MPNWCKNIIVPRDYEAMKNALVVDDDHVDFNLVIPRSSDLDIVSGGICYKYSQSRCLANVVVPAMGVLYNETDTQDAFVNKVLKQILNNYNADALKKDIGDCAVDFKEDKSEDHSIANYIRGYFNLQRYGACDWYDWSVNHWGTKWNACDTFLDNSTIEFDTAWAPPDGIYDELAKKFDFVVLFADEGYSPVGYYIYEDGELVDSNTESGCGYNEAYFLGEFIFSRDIIPFEEVEYWDGDKPEEAPVEYSEARKTFTWLKEYWH